MKTIFKPNLKLLLYKYEYDFIKWIDKECKEYLGDYNRYSSDNSPMWIQYKGFNWENKDKIYFSSSQFSSMNLTIKLNKKDIDLFLHYETSKEMYNHFRDLKYNYIRENYPTIYDLHSSWRQLTYNKN